MYHHSRTFRPPTILESKMDNVYEAIVKCRKKFNGKDKQENIRKSKEYVDFIADVWRGSNPKTDIRKKLPVV
jgi:hypothetical protein